jgi:hypothetical protein
MKGELLLVRMLRIIETSTLHFISIAKHTLKGKQTTLLLLVRDATFWLFLTVSG